MMDSSTEKELPPNFYPLTSLQIGKIRRYSSSSFLFSAPESKKLLILVELDGLLVFEVAWKDVCGIKYTNDLQTDASIALEAKSMQRWKFKGPGKASRYIASWFSGTDSEVKNLKNWLSIRADWRSSSETVEEIGEEHLKNISGAKFNNSFILFRFRDDNLTADLRRIILDDRRLRKLLESGIPSWAIFFQSYPLFMSCYRPWMRLLVRTIHGMILLVSFTIAFYDLYRNIPIIKSDIYRISDLFFRWSEACNSLLYQNLEIPIKWFLKKVRLLAAPLATAGMWIVLAPFWTVAEALFSFIGVLISFFISKTATLIQLIFTTAWEIFLPARKILGSLKLAFIRHICDPFIRWLEASEMLSFPYLGTMFLLQNFAKAVEWFLGTLKLLAEPLPSLTPIRKICVGMVELIPWDPFLSLIRDFFEITSSSIAEIGKLIGPELTLFPWVWSWLKLTAETARGPLRDLLKLLPSFSAGGGSGYSWRDLRKEFLSWKVLGSVKTVASGLFTFFLNCRQRDSMSWRVPCTSDLPPISPEHGDHSEDEAGTSIVDGSLSNFGSDLAGVNFRYDVDSLMHRPASN